MPPNNIPQPQNNQPPAYDQGGAYTYPAPVNLPPEPYTQPSPQQPIPTPPAPNNSQPDQTDTHNRKIEGNRQTSTQNSLLLSELRDNMIIMADGSFRAVVACQSINFDLMSSNEREAVEFSYQNFLNALYFPIQIFIRSQRVDIGPYLERLESLRQAQDNMLLSVLMDDYIQFIEVLSEEANIMDKSFFVVVPYYPAGDISSVVKPGKALFGKMFAKNQSSVVGQTIDQTTYEKAKDEIRSRVEAVTSSLMQVGIHSVQLTTKELGELYYNVYNPDTAVREPLRDFSAVTSTYVRRGDTSAPAQPTNQGGMN